MLLLMRKASFLILVLGMAISIFLLAAPLLTAESNYAAERVAFTHFFTKALCSPANLCEDYEVYCDNENALNVKATGYSIQFPEDWKDPRTEEEKKNIC